MSKKFGCFKVETVADRCMEISPFSKMTPFFPTKAECMRNCNTDEEEEALRKLREKFRIKDLTEMIRPGLIASFDKIKDMPLLNYKGSPYASRILNSDELYHFYSTLVRRTSYGKHDNIFLDDIKKKLNVFNGTDIIVTFTETRSNTVKGIDFKEEFDSEFLENRQEFEKELTAFIASPSTFMIKNILINNFITEINHHTIMLIKKEQSGGKNLLNFFIYDPTAGSYVNLYDLMELFLKDACSAISVDCKITQLSKIYGLQNLEKHTKNNEMIMKGINKEISENMTNIYDEYREFNKYLLQRIYVYLANKYNSKSHIPIDINGKQYPKDFTNILLQSEIYKPQMNLRMWISDDKITFKIFNDNDGWLKQSIDVGLVTVEELKSYEDDIVELGRNFFPSIFKDHILEDELVTYIKFIYTNLYTFEHDKFIPPIMHIFKKIVQKLMTNIIKLRMKMEDLDNQINKHYKMDYFSGYCYLWSYYTIILILMNQTIDPYTVIKGTFFQTIDEPKMRGILESQVYDLQSILNYESSPHPYFFNKNYIDEANANIEEAKRELPTFLTPDSNELARKTFFKITNFLLLNILYNKISDKYLSYKYSKTSQGEITLNTFIAPKVDEILKNFSLHGLDTTLPEDDLKRAFIDKVLEGELLVEVNAKIVAAKPTTPLVLESKYQYVQNDYKTKYLKYKSKYLDLKKRLN